MKFHLSREERYLLFFLAGCLLAFLLVKYLGIESFRFRVESELQKSQPIFPIDLNKASFQELLTVPGIGPVLAERIINYRYESSGFKKLEELMQVKGIGEKKFQTLKKYFKL